MDSFLKNAEIDGICKRIKDNKDKIATEAMDADIAKKLGEGNVVPPPQTALVPNPNPNIDALRRYATRLPPISNGVLAANQSTYQAWRAQPCWVEENFWTRTQQYRRFEST